MKVAVALCLLACVAVSQAAFSSSLVDSAQPLLNQAMFKVRLSSRSANPNIQTTIIQGIHDQANAVLAQIENGVHLAQDAIANLQAAYAELLEQAQNLGGSLASQIGNIASNLLNSLSNVWGSIFGKAGGKGLWDLLSGGIGNVWDMVQQNIGNLDIQQLIQLVLQQHLPTWASNLIINQLLGGNAAEKGIWNSITNGISGGLNAMLGQISDLVGNLWQGAQNSFSNVQQLAQQFLNEAMEQGSAIGSQACEQMLAFLAPHAAGLGSLWTDIEAQVSQIHQLIGSPFGIKKIM